MTEASAKNFWAAWLESFRILTATFSPRYDPNITSPNSPFPIDSLSYTIKEKVNKSQIIIQIYDLLPGDLFLEWSILPLQSLFCWQRNLFSLAWLHSSLVLYRGHLHPFHSAARKSINITAAVPALYEYLKNLLQQVLQDLKRTLLHLWSICCLCIWLCNAEHQSGSSHIVCSHPGSWWILSQGRAHLPWAAAGSRLVPWISCHETI